MPTRTSRTSERCPKEWRGEREMESASLGANSGGEHSADVAGRAENWFLDQAYVYFCEATCIPNPDGDVNSFSSVFLH